MAPRKPRRRGGAEAERAENGRRTRDDIVSAALALAATEGLEGMTLGRVASTLGLSKAGIYAHFSSKEALQMEALDVAFAEFADEVAAPGLAAEPGLPRLHALLHAYVAYIERRSGRGGCFFTSLALEYDDRPGAVRDRLRALLQQRTALVTQALEEARKLGQLHPTVDPRQLAFEAIALTLGANVEFMLTKDRAVFRRLWRALGGNLGSLSRAPLSLDWARRPAGAARSGG
jgi:AcrR family transcriptional regulator